MSALLLFTALFVAVPDRPMPKQPPKVAQSVQQSLIGDWRLISLTIPGQKDPEKGKDTILQFTPTMIHMIENGQQNKNDDAGYSLDVSKSPIAIDLIMANESKEKIEGILKIEGDRLTFCFAFGGKGMRPTAFVAEPNSTNAMMVFTRIQKK